LQGANGDAEGADLRESEAIESATSERDEDEGILLTFFETETTRSSSETRVNPGRYPSLTSSLKSL
jgi:hypothetical protein